MKSSRKAQIIIFCITLVLGVGGWFFVTRPRSLEDHSTTVAERYIIGDICWILDHRIEKEKEEVPKTKNLELALRTTFERASKKFRVVGLEQEKGSISMAQAHTNIKCRSLLHGGTFTLVAPCHLTPEGVRSPLSYFLSFIWTAEYLAERKNPRSDIPNLLEAKYVGLQRDGSTLNASGLKKVSGDGITFISFSDWMPRIERLRKMFIEAADNAREK